MSLVGRQVDWTYRNLLIIWTSMFSAHFLLLLLFVMIPDEFHVDRSKPFIGEHYAIVPLAILVSLGELILSYFQHSSYLKKAISTQNPELVQLALIKACSNCLVISLIGVLLGWRFEYPYFYLWFLCGIFATIFYCPKRSDLAAAGHIFEHAE